MKPNLSYFSFTKKYDFSLIGFSVIIFFIMVLYYRHNNKKTEEIKKNNLIKLVNTINIYNKTNSQGN